MISMTEFLEVLHSRLDGGHAGGRREFWVLFHQRIGEFITAQKLKPVPAEHLGSLGLPETAEMRALRPRPWPGGMVGPHLHFGGDVYLLSLEQWRAFSGTIVKEVRERLDKAQTVSFEGLVEMGAAAARL